MITTPPRRFPRVVIIIPVYNAAAYLQECLDSISRQRYKQFDVFAVNDGSSDNSGSILDAYATSNRWLKVIHKANGGVSSARNAALNALSDAYKYVSFVDSDDTLEPNYLSELVSTAEKESADLVAFLSKSFDKCSTYYEQKSEYAVLNSDGIWRSCLSPKGDGCFWTMHKNFMSYAVVKDIRFDESLSIAEDADFLFRAIMSIKKCVLLPEYLYNYRIRKSSLCHDIKNDLRLNNDSAIAFEKVDATRIPKDLLSEYYRFIFRFEFKAMYLATNARLGEDDFEKRKWRILRLPKPKDTGQKRFQFKYTLLHFGFAINRLYYRISCALKNRKRISHPSTANMFE